MALKILLAEDEEALSRVYKAALEHQGYEVDQAFNGHFWILDVVLVLHLMLQTGPGILSNGPKLNLNKIGSYLIS